MLLPQRRQYLPPANASKLFRAGKFFRPGRTFRAETPSPWGSPDPTSWTPESTHQGSHCSHGPSPGYSRKDDYTSIQKGRVRKLEGGCHSSLGSSGDISISHTGVSHSHLNVPHASVSHYATSPDSSGLRRPPNRTPLSSNGSFPSGPLLSQIG